MILAPRPPFRASRRPPGGRYQGFQQAYRTTVSRILRAAPKATVQGVPAEATPPCRFPMSMPVPNVPARLGIPAGLFRASLRVGRQAGKPAAEATQQRSIPDSLHLAMLEPVYRLAPDLLRSGRVRPPQDVAATRELRMTDFRLLRPGGFYHALARYGPDLWTPFTYAGLHATERSLRRKEQHRFWGADRYLRIGNRLFYEDPDQAVEPSGQIVVAATPGPGNWPAIPCPAPRPRCSAPTTGSAARRWSCVPPGT